VSRRPKLAAAHPLSDELPVDRPERPCVAASGELAEHGAVESPLRLRDEVERVVRQELVVPRSGMHHHRRREIALDEDAVAALTGSLEGDLHARETSIAERRSSYAER
jgi:hypothetical protein